MTQDWVIIGISGVTCGGKTTLANKLRENLSPVYVFHQDKYFYPDDSPKHVKCKDLDHNNYDILSSLDMDAMFSDIMSTIRGDNKAHKFSEEDGKFEIKGKKFMVVEGFTVLNFKPILELCHLRYYFILEYGECITRRCYRLYDPPDIDGYFDQCVWPEHLKYRAETHFLFLSTSALPKTIKPPMATQPEEDVFYNLFASIGAQESADEYYAFLEPSFKYPPKVRPPPYREENRGCSVSFDDIDGNLCGDLNKEGIPQNPMGQRPHRQSYPFELIRNHTLRFLPRTQPELSTNDTLPQVTYYYPKTYNAKPLTISGEVLPAHPLLEGETTEQDADSLPLYLVPPGRQRRAAGSYGWSFCADGGLLCTVESYVKAYADYYDVKGWLRDLGLAPVAAPEPPHTTTTQPLSDALSTCPARVKYVTPLFARNYQGAWRYVVQLPHEELFTQSVEVTRCLESQCQSTDGQCKSFPRWVSLLVAEIDYPPQDQNLQKEHTPLVLLQAEYQQFRQNGTAQPAAAQPSADQHTHCDGHDEKGCYQVKVYYDKFLVPGSCRCWRRGFLEEYRRNYQTEL